MSAIRAYLCLTLVAATAACSNVAMTPPPVEDPRDPNRTAPIERAESEQAVDPAPPGQTTAATDSLLAAADAAHDRHDYVGAIAHLERAIRIDPRNSSLWVRLSREHLTNEDLEVAAQHARKAIALAGNDAAHSAEAWLALADVYEAQGRLTEAQDLRRRYRGVRG